MRKEQYVTCFLCIDFKATLQALVLFCTLMFHENTTVMLEFYVTLIRSWPLSFVTLIAIEIIMFKIQRKNDINFVTAKQL